MLHFKNIDDISLLQCIVMLYTASLYADEMLNECVMNVFTLYYHINFRIM